MKSIKGSLLIAAPGLADPNFARSVVLVVEHTAEGAFGLILNRPSEKTTLLEFFETLFAGAEAIPARELLQSYRVYAGGPVQTSELFFLHSLSRLADEEAPWGAYLGVDVEELRAVLGGLTGEEPARFRVFLGYSGWGPGQLEKELHAGGWLVRPASAAEIFSDLPEDLWGALIRGFGGDLGILGHLPRHPELN